jgi:signal transduction histidine kinase
MLSNTFSRKCCLFVVSMALLIMSARIFADPVNKQQITAIYINSISKSITWPLGSNKAFRIGIVGDANGLILKQLVSLTQNTKVNNFPVSVEPTEINSTLSNFNIVYVESPNSKNIGQFYEHIGNSPVLLITTEYANKQSVMINLLNGNDGRVKFEVNKSNIINQGLKPLPDLILFGGSEIDVAKLFKDSQESLISLTKQLQFKEKTLSDLTQNIQHQESKNLILEKKTSQLSAEIEKSEKLILGQNALLTKSESNRMELVHEVDFRTNQINALQSQLVKITSEIEKREARVSSLNRAIELQEREISAKNVSISNLGDTVSYQKLKLVYMYCIVIIVGILFIVTIISRRIIKKKNKILEDNKKDLLIAANRLSMSKKRADEASKAKGDFLSLISHELRTPIQAIIGYTEVVADNLKSKGLDDEISDLNRVISNSERLLKLINAILELAKIEAGRMQLDMSEIKLSHLVNEAIDITSPLFRSSNNKITLDVDDGSFLPTADPEKIVAMLVNLIGNANKFTENGEIRVKGHHESDQLLIEVSDSGVGISEDKLHGIFDKFFQVKSGAHGSYSGSGLGLAIVREMTECMGGTILVKSEVGHGTTFSITIPLPIDISNNINHENLLMTLPKNMYEPKKDDSFHILTIDDDRATVEIMKRILTKDGYVIHSASTAQAGLTIASEIIPDLITIDLLLPDSHGLKFIKKIKEQKMLANIPIIIISSEEGSATEKMAADDFLTKPVRHQLLRDTIERHLTKK